MDHADGYRDPPPDFLESLLQAIFPEAVRQLGDAHQQMGMDADGNVLRVRFWRRGDPTPPVALEETWRARDRQQIRDHDRAFLTDLHIRWDADLMDTRGRS